MQNNIFKTTMNNGLVLGVLFFVNFLLSTASNAWIGLITYLITIVIVIFTYKKSIRYRDVDCKGHIKYGTVFSFVVLSFLFASLVTAILKIIYLKYINTDFLPNLYEQMLAQIDANQALFEGLLDRFNAPLDDDFYEKIEKMMNPVSYAIQTIWVNILYGGLLGAILGFIVMKKESIFDDKTLNNS